MTKKQSSILNDLEQLIKKTTEANTVFFSEGNRFIKNFDVNSWSKGNVLEDQKDLMTDAFNTFMKLNIQYASNLIDLGLAFSERVSHQAGESVHSDKTDSEKAETPQPAFILDLVGKPGEVVKTEFQLDSNKPEPIECLLVQTPFAMKGDHNGSYSFETQFTHQSFRLIPGASQKVKMSIAIPKDAALGEYMCSVRVQGYDQAFFGVYLKILEPDKKPGKKASTKTRTEK